MKIIGITIKINLKEKFTCTHIISCKGYLIALKKPDGFHLKLLLFQTQNRIVIIDFNNTNIYITYIHHCL